MAENRNSNPQNGAASKAKAQPNSKANRLAVMAKDSPLGDGTRKAGTVVGFTGADGKIKFDEKALSRREVQTLERNPHLVKLVDHPKDK